MRDATGNADLLREQGGYEMRSATRRLLVVMAVPVLAMFAVAVGWTGVASAHHVSGIDVNCEYVTVNFSEFPAAGVNVHIAATIQGQETLATDVLTHDEMTAQLAIASATSALAGASATVDVDVTWTYEGPQHVHDTFTVTCGSSSTTTTEHHCGCGSTTTTVAIPATTTTIAESTTTTTLTGVGETSTTEGNGHSPSTTVVKVSGNEASGGPTPVSGAPAESAGGAILPTGNARAATGPHGSLPFTGGVTLPLLGAALVLLAVGAVAVMHSRARRGLTKY